MRQIRERELNETEAATRSNYDVRVDSMLIGLISDTHGLIRPEALRAFTAVDLILHAGDVGRRSVLDALGSLAPVGAVHGNIDLPSEELPAAIEREIDGVRIHVSHGHEIGSPTPERLTARYLADVIVFGHTHRALVQHAGTTLVINPGAAGPARFNLRPSVALLTLPQRQARILFL